jgi:hypothetical protein
MKHPQIIASIHELHQRHCRRTQETGLLPAAARS